MFAASVDEQDWDDLNELHYEWPSVEDLLAYRQKVRKLLVPLLENKLPLTRLPLKMDDPFWIILLGTEYERVNYQEVAAIIRRIPTSMLNNQDTVSDFKKICPERKFSGYDAKNVPNTATLPQTPYISIKGGRVSLGLRDNGEGVFRWDNQLGERQVDVAPFKVNKYLTSNQEYLEFINDGGYSNESLWTDEGW